MVLGVLAAITGSVEIDGIDISKSRALALARTNFAAVYTALPGNLTVLENLRFFGLLYSILALPRRVDELLQEFDLEHLRHTKCGVLSSGEQTRAALSKALLNKPQLLLLDEPTASLDPSAAQVIRAKIRSLATIEHCGILWTSHTMNEVEAACDCVLFLSCGKILLEGDPKTLPHEHGSATLEELFIRVAHEPLAAAGQAQMRAQACGCAYEVASHRRPCLAPVLFVARQFGARLPHGHLGGHRHCAVRLHHPLPQLGEQRRHGLRAHALRRRVAVGFLRPHHARSVDGFS